MIFASCQIDYRSPGYFDDEVAVRVRPGRIGTKSFRLDFDMRVGERLLAEGHGVLVAFDYGALRSVELPEALRERLAAAVG
jgi:acyl-CoA thioester hydrolase